MCKQGHQPIEYDINNRREVVSVFSNHQLKRYDFVKFFSKEVKIETKFDCSRADRRFSTNPRSALYISYAPPEHKMNLLCALLMYRRSGTHICNVKTAFEPPCEGHWQCTELPERNT